jgi:hypothetical protein
VTVLTVVVVVETIVLALLSVVVVALLRSHAEVLSRLPVLEDDEHEHDHDGGPQALSISSGPNTTQVPSHLPAPRGSATPAHDVAGETLQGEAAAVSMSTGRPTLVAFLSSGCLTCRTFWEGLRPEVRRPLPQGARLIVVVKDRAFESPSKLAELASDDVLADVLVVHSSQAWEDFDISMSPYFCFVDGGGDVRSEGAATTWDQVHSLLADALADEDLLRPSAGARG